MSDIVQGITLKDWLGFSVVGTLITVTGSFIALYAKEFMAVRSIERWKSREVLTAIYDRYRRPICAAGEELSGRCYTNAMKPRKWRETAGLDLLRTPLSDETPSALANNRFYRYKLLSDAYRLCCFLGWLELYRRDLGLINVNAKPEGQKLEEHIRHIRSALADGQMNYHERPEQWRDSLIFREEQRAIAHRMIASGSSIGLIDFGTFCEMADKELKGGDSDRWFTTAIHFFSNLRTERDFRLTRMKWLVVHLTALRQLLQPKSIPDEHIKGSESLKEELEKERSEAKAKKGPTARCERSGRSIAPIRRVPLP